MYCITNITSSDAFTERLSLGKSHNKLDDTKRLTCTIRDYHQPPRRRLQPIVHGHYLYHCSMVLSSRVWDKHVSPPPAATAIRSSMSCGWIPWHSQVYGIWDHTRVNIREQPSSSLLLLWCDGVMHRWLCHNDKLHCYLMTHSLTVLVRLVIHY